MRIIVAPAMRSKFKYYQQKGLAEFFNTIGRELPPDPGTKRMIFTTRGQCPPEIPKIAQFPRRHAISCDLDVRPRFPRTRVHVRTLHCCMRLREAAALCSELVMEFVERRGPVALAGKFAVETAIEHRLDADRQQDAHYLHLHRAAQRVEPGPRPRQDLIAAIETDQMVDLLCCREMPPTGRKVGDARHVREGNDAAVVETDALFARSL